MSRDKFFKDGDLKECPSNSHIPRDGEPIQDGDCVCGLGNPGDNDGKGGGCYRYAAYANRFRTAVRASARSAARYLAYTSDIGESFRPVVPLFVVRLGYAVSWAYVITDVSFQSWKAKMRKDGRYQPNLMPWHRAPPPNPSTAAAAADERGWKVVAVKEMVFQSLASMGLPAFTIHTVVAHSGFMYKNFCNPKVRKFGPVFNGLAIVPFLPFMFDKPVEEAVEWVTVKAEEAYERRHKKE